MLSRRDPFRDMLTMRRAMDRLMESTFSEDLSGTPEWGLALDVIEDEDSYQVKASVPGVKPEDIEITYNKGVLTIKGEVKDDSEKTTGQYHLRERRFGSFARSISLPSTVEADAIQASYQEGVLTLSLPKAEEVKPKRIAINANAQKVIDQHKN